MSKAAGWLAAFVLAVVRPIGDNAWKKADAVFLFDEFYIPRRSVVATAQGLQGLKATDGVLASMRTLSTKVLAVEAR
jgi:hypothetical protein